MRKSHKKLWKKFERFLYGLDKSENNKMQSEQPKQNNKKQNDKLDKS